MEEETTQQQNVKKLGIHLISNAIWAQTGYGGQAKLILPRLQALGYPVSMTGYYGLQGHTLKFNDMMVYPCGYHPYGMDVAAGNAKQEQADVLMTNVDVWVCEPAMFVDVPWVPWYPIDSGSINPLILSKLPQSFDRIAMSKFAQKMVQDAGLQSRYIPCSIDTKVFTPSDKKRALDEMNLHIPAKVPENAYLVSMVAMNKGAPSRKAFFQQFRAFKKFKDAHPEAVLYAHTIRCEHGEQGGINLVEICNFLGLQVNKDVLFPDPLLVINGYPDIFLNAVYNASDVFLSVTMGEGFGIPIVEAQAAGCPVIIGDWTSMSELLFSGWRVTKKEAHEQWTLLSAIQYDPSWEAIADRLEMAYQMRGNQEYRNRARDGALAYDVDKVVEKYWVPTLDAIAAKLKDRPKFIEAPK
jgi:glycosyltransferase involved in cell wall biosynthesis